MLDLKYFYLVIYVKKSNLIDNIVKWHNMKSPRILYAFIFWSWPLTVYTGLDTEKPRNKGGTIECLLSPVGLLFRTEGEATVDAYLWKSPEWLGSLKQTSVHNILFDFGRATNIIFPSYNVPAVNTQDGWKCFRVTWWVEIVTDFVWLGRNATRARECYC